MSVPTPHSVHQPGVSLDDANWQPKMASITLWLQKEWSTLEEKFNASALGSIHDLMEKAPALLVKLDELNDLKQQNLNQIQQHEAQWRQAVDAPHTADQSKDLAENAAWRKTFDLVIRKIKMFSKAIADEFPVADKQVIEEVVKIGPSLLKALDEVRRLQQERLSEIEQCKTNWSDAITARKGKLAELDELVAKQQPAVEAAKKETNAQQSELSRVRLEIQRESTQLTSLLHQRMNADRKLVETQEKAKQLKRSLKEKGQSHNKQVDEDGARIEEMRHRQDDRERNLTERERQFEATCAEREQARFLAEKKLEDEGLILQSESRKLQNGNEKAQRQWDLLCDYRDMKDAQVITINEKAENLQASVDQLEEDRTSLQAIVRDRDSRLQEMGKKLTEANHSLETMSKSRDGLAAELKRQNAQLQATASIQSELEASNTTINTLNDNIAQTFAAQNQNLASSEANTNEQTKSITRDKDLEEMVSTCLREGLAGVRNEVSKARTEHDWVKKGYETTIGELQTQVRHLEQQLSVKETVLLESSSAGLLMETCHAEVQSPTRELDSAREDIRKLEKMRDVQECKIHSLEQQQLEAKAQNTEQQDMIKTLESRIEGFRNHESTIHRLNGQVSDCQKAKFDLKQALADTRIELDHTSGDNKRIAEEFRQLMISKNRVLKQLEIANGKLDIATKKVIELRHSVSQEGSTTSQPGFCHGEDEILDNPGIPQARTPKRFAINSDSDNVIGFPSTSITGDDNHEILSTRRIPALSSRKRVADNKTYDAQEQRKRHQIGSDVHDGLSPGSALREQRTVSTRDSSIGAPIANSSSPQCHVYPVADVWDVDFGDGRIPATVIDKVRSQMKAWNKRKPTWMGSDKRRCANSFAGKKTGDWAEGHGCEGCADKGLVCIAVYQDTVELLPLKDAGEVGVSGEGYWFKRTEG